MRKWSVVYQREHCTQNFGHYERTHTSSIDLFRIPKYDLIYIFMYVTPLLTSFMERLVITLANRVIYDIEDNVHTQHNQISKIEPNPLVKFLKWPGVNFYPSFRSCYYIIPIS